MPKQYSLLSDPLFYIMLGFFAVLTTALATSLGQPRFLPISQTLVLFAFLVAAFRRGLVRPALSGLAVWLLLQLGAMIITSRFAPGQAERAISAGFVYRTSLNGWLYGAEALPASLLVEPIGRLVELLGVLLGSLVSGGLVGLWFLISAADRAAYGAGALWHETGSIAGVLAGLPPWTLIRLAGYAGLIVLLAEPLFTGNWRVSYYLSQRRRLLLVSTALLLIGLALEVLLPGLWRAALA